MIEYLRGFVTALHTITIIPIWGKDTSNFSKSLYWFPLVGTLLGAIIYLPLALYQIYVGPLWSEVTAFSIIIYSIFITRGFHLDGVADWADGFWGGYDRERVLSIMKDSLLGTFGVLALIVLILFKWILLVKIIDTHLLPYIIASFVISRCVQVEIAASYPYARLQGTAASIVKDSNWTHRLVASLLTAIILYLFFGWIGLILLVAAILFTHLFGQWCLKRIQGITGDLIGACSEFTEVLVLSLVILISSFSDFL